jgi:hypothetical protein
MQNRHLIAKQVFELRVGLDKGHIPQLQDAFSRQYWQSVIPAFERLFDRLIGPDELVRVDRIELDVGRWSAENILSGKFVESLVSRLESVISSALRGTDFEADVQPIRTGRFDLWLHFLEHGSLAVGATRPDSQKAWHRQVIECLATESSAVQRFRNLVSMCPVALERLILQHDEAFLRQLLEFLTNRRQDDLQGLVDDVVNVVVRAVTDLSDRIRAVGKETPTELERIVDVLFDALSDLLALPPDSRRESELKRRIVQALDREASNPMALARWLIQADSWRMLLSGFEQPEVSHTLSNRIVEVLRESTILRSLAAEPTRGPTLAIRDLVRRVKLAVWRNLFDEVVVKRRQGDASKLIARVIHSEALQPWRGILLRRLNATGDMKGRDGAWRRMAEAIEARPPSALHLPGREDKAIEVAKREALAADEAEKLPISDAGKGGLYYVQSAGVILFHPFLMRFFQKLGLYKEGAFIDETSRQRAVCLVHHLATGEVRTPEYQLVLPKFLCGMPLNAPIDHFIEIEATERTESENLNRAVIEHWEALGKVSPEWLREMFLQRDGKLEKRETGWRLKVERKAQDILLDRLPQGWGLGIVKLPWMDELLRVDW